MKSHPLSKSDSNDIIADILSQWKLQIPKPKTLILHEVDENTLLITSEDFTAIRIDKTYLPLLSETSLLEKFPRIIVDAGAIKFVCNGANVMRPGIRKYTEFKKDDLVCVAEETHNKFLAVGKAIISSEEMPNITKGEVVKNLHYVSDKYWESAKLLKK